MATSFFSISSAAVEIVFALARKPKSGRIFFGGSDFAVWELDLEQAKLEPKALGHPDSDRVRAKTRAPGDRLPAVI